jgi:hypothetical protein
MKSTAEVLIAGLGNIGSPLAGLIVRLGLRRLVLVDRDRVEAKNVAVQDYRHEDVGRFKADVMAERLRSQFSECIIEARPVDLEDLPLGVAKVDLILGALDSRRARQLLVSEIAWPLGVPVIDGGVGEGWRGRVQVFVPQDGFACLECGWGREEYRQLSAEYPCIPGATAEAPPTRAPVFLGAATASMMAAEAARLLDRETQSQSEEIAFDLLHRRQLVSKLRHNPRCRFGHEIVKETLTFDGHTAGDLLHMIRARLGPGEFFHLEARRGLGNSTAFASSRLLSAEWLADAGPAPLDSLGFHPLDLLRVRTVSGSLFVRLSHDN